MGKGAADGGLDVPHSEKRFPGYDRDAKEYDADTHRERIFGGHVSEYMEYLEEEDNQKYQEHFAKDIDGDGLEELYESVHEKIREDPSPSEKKSFTPDKSYKRKSKLTYDDVRLQSKRRRRLSVPNSKKKRRSKFSVYIDLCLIYSRKFAIRILLFSITTIQSMAFFSLRL